MNYGIRWVSHAAIRPHRCALNPMIGNHNSVKGFLDFGTDLGGVGQHPGDHVYVSVLMLEQAAEHLGWAAPASVAAERAALERAGARIADLEQQLEAATKFREAAEYTLGQFGAKVKSKPGRKPAAVQ